MKAVIVEISHFFSKKYGLTVSQINFKLTSKRQIEYCTGLLDYEPSQEQKDAIEKFYRKRLANCNYTFLNTELTIHKNKFNILSLRA